MRRIAIIGNAGGGKTTLARALGETAGLPVLEFDHLEWQPGWVRTPQADDATHARWLAEPGWIIDGWGTAELIEARFHSADTIVVIDRAFVVHVAWMLKRYAGASLGLTRNWPPPGCPPDVRVVPRLLGLMWYMQKTALPAVLATLNTEPFRGRFVHLRSAREIRAWQQQVSHGRP